MAEEANSGLSEGTSFLLDVKREPPSRVKDTSAGLRVLCRLSLGRVQRELVLIERIR